MQYQFSVPSVPRMRAITSSRAASNGMARASAYAAGTVSSQNTLSKARSSSVPSRSSSNVSQRSGIRAIGILIAGLLS